MARKVFSLNLDPGVVARVDAARGDVARSRFVERALEQALADPGAALTPVVSPAPARASVSVLRKPTPLGFSRGPKRDVKPIPQRPS